MLKSLKKTNLVLFTVVLSIIGITTIYLTKNLNINDIINQIDALALPIKAISMLAMISLQILIAFIPGEPLELASGYLFGSLGGTIVCLVGSIIGTIIVYYVAKIFQHRIINFMFNQEKVAEVEKLFSSKKSKFWLFIIFLIPGSPKDVMTYLVSLTDIDLKQWLLITTVGRIPSIVTSTYLADSLKYGNYKLALFIFMITIILVVGGMIYYKKIIK